MALTDYNPAKTRNRKPARKAPPKIAPHRGIPKPIGQNAPPAPRVSRPTYEQRIHQGTVAGPARRQSRTIRAAQTYKRKAVQPAPKGNQYERRISTGKAAGPSITESRTVRSTPKPRPSLPSRLAHGLVDILTHPGENTVGTVGPTNNVRRGHRTAVLPGATVQSRGLSGSPAGSLPALTLKNLAQATYEHPGAVSGNTVKGLAEIIAGTPAGIGELVGGTFGPLATGHPERSLHALGRYGSAFGSDISRRYGPLLKGDEAGFRKRVVEEGAAPELLDLTAAVGGGGAALGRALTPLARAGRLGERLERVATVRPALQRSGNLVRSQEISPNLFRAGVQRGEDILREKVRGTHAAEGPVTQTGQAPHPAVRPLLERRGQRIAISGRGAQSHLANKIEQNVVLTKGVERDLAGMSPRQREGVFHAVQGIVPLVRHEGETREAYIGRVRRQLEKRKADIASHHEANPDAPKPLHDKAEANALDRLIEHADEIYGDGKVAAFYEKYAPVSREKGLADPGVHDLDVATHPYRVQGEHLGISHDPVKRLSPAEANAEASRLDELAKNLRAGAAGQRESGRFSFGLGNEVHLDRMAADAEKQAKALRDGTVAGEPLQGAELRKYNEDYVTRVKAAAERHGLPDPIYFRHQEFPTSGFGVRTAANLYRAVQGAKHSELKLFKRGQAIIDPDVFVQGLAGNIKRRHQWNAVADTVQAHALPWSRKPNGQGKDLLTLRREIANRGLNPDDFEFINFGRFRRFTATADETLDTPSDLRDALEGAIQKPSQLRKLPDEELAKLQGFVAVPKGAGEELKTAIAPTGKASRLAGKVQGFQSGAILGLNPSWATMQVAANALQYGIGSHDFKALFNYRYLPDDIKQIVDRQVGVGVGKGHATSAHLGSTGGSLVQHGRAIGQIPLIKSKRGTVRVTDLNPTTPLFAIDELQNRAFRRAALTSEAKRTAYRNMRKELGLAAEAQERVSNLLRLKPTEKLDAQLRRVLENPKDIEKLGEHANNVLGDYLRYTSRERRFLKPTLMFYGFMRYALKTLFYTLPIKHPIAMSLIGKIGQLHNEEIRHIFGDRRDLPPWVFSRVFLFDKNGNVRRNSKGQIKSIDLLRINPVTNVAVDVVGASAKGKGVNFSPFAGLLSPIAQAAVGQVVGKDLFQDRGFMVKGSAEERRPPDLVTAGRIVGADLLSAAFPVREGMKLAYRGKQGDDALPFSPRPIHYKTAGPQAKEAQRMAALPSRGEALRQDLAPLVFPKGDTTEAFLKEHPSGGAPTDPAKAFQAKYGIKGGAVTKESFQKKYGVKSAGMSKKDFQAKYGVGQ